MKLLFFVFVAAFFNQNIAAQNILAQYKRNMAVPYADSILFEKGSVKTYTGKQLALIQFPIGGIGTGDLLLGGRGQIDYLEFFNRPNRRDPAAQTFFSIWIKEEGKAPIAKIVEREYFPPYNNNSLSQLRGIQRFDEVLFNSNYPFADLMFTDADIPLQISMEAYNPFIPLDADNSSIPAAIFNWRIKNNSLKSVETVLAFSMSNPVKYRDSNKAQVYGGNLNQVLRGNGYNGIKMTNTLNKKTDYNYAEVVFGTTAPVDDVQTRWYHGSYGVGQIAFWSEFSRTGKLHNVKDEKPSSHDKTDVATLTVKINLQPGEEKTIPFYISWYSPNRQTTEEEALEQLEAVNKPFRNYYANKFESAESALSYLIANKDELYSASKTFSETINNSTYPLYVKDALLSQATTIKTPLIHRMENGDTHGFEGVGSDSWCCPGTCTHVWNYEQTLAFLFPALERTMREVSFLHDTHPNGYQTFRSVFPLGNYFFDGPPAADGQFGNIIRVYREWKLSGDNNWLKKLWPKVKLALEFAWKGPGKIDNPKLKYQENKDTWDANKTGILTGEQHNTYDINFYGPSSMTSSLYLAALKACTEMAVAMKEPEKAKEYEDVFKKGQVQFEKILWNGEYYVQVIDEKREINDTEIGYGSYSASPPDANGKILPRYQYGNGCLSDQLLGQYLAHTCGLKYLLEPKRVDSAILAIFKNNFISGISKTNLIQRTYAYNDEAGLLLCSWPYNDRPVIPFVYSDEIWTGVEYQVAASLIYSGHVKEGLTIAKATRDRYDGYKRNPFAEDESGVHYARAMASWSLLLALSGYQYDGIAMSMEFAPKISHRDFSSFWSSGTAWGNVAIINKQIKLKVEFGKQELKQFSLQGYNFSKLKLLTVEGKPIKASLANKAGKNIIDFKKPVTINKGAVLEFVFE